MTFAISLSAPGGVDALAGITLDLEPPRAGEVRLRHEAIGVNFVDVYQRTGLYPASGRPVVLGVEGAGIVEAVGDGVGELAVGDRVAYAGLPNGGYASERNIPARRLVRIPDGIDMRTAAAAMLRGVTAHMLLFRVHPVGPDSTVLVQAAAGGLGQILTAWAKRLGATVIGTVGSPAKAAIARARGADHVVVHRTTDVAAEVRRSTDGRGVDVAYDGIGGDALLATLDCVRPFGTVVSVGQASGSLPTIALTELGPRRSLMLARPSALGHVEDRAAYVAATAALFAEIAAGLDVSIGLELPLAEAAEAHRRLERGDTTGSILLRP